MATNQVLSNPYNQAGQMHNNGMAYVINYLNSSSTIDKIIETCANYLQNLSGNDTQEEFFDNCALIASSINRSENLGIEGMLDWLLQKELITEDGMDFIRSIDGISDKTPLAEVVSIIEGIERDILNSTITVELQAYPLLYASISKHSASYGLEQENNPNSPWHGVITANRGWPWKKDARGAVSGAIGGAIGGIPGGLAGVGLGFLLGAIGGALGASVVAAIFDPN